MTRALIVLMLVSGVACKKKERTPAPPPMPVAVADAAPAQPVEPAAKADASVAASGADATVSASDSGAAAEEEDNPDGCPKQLKPEQVKESADYKVVCEKALTKVMGCRKDSKLTSQLHDEDKGWGKNTAATMKRAASSAKAVTDTCDLLAHDLHCGYQGRSFSQVAEVGDWQKIADAADCSAAGATLAEISFMPTGE